MRTHETVLVFYNNFGTYNEQTTLGNPYKIKRKMSQFQTSYGKQRDHESINEGTRRAKSVIKIKNPRVKGGHSTEKPVALMEYLIKTYSNPGEVVLDFAVGRGTTLVAAHNLGRRFIGIEKDKSYFDISYKRINEATKDEILTSNGKVIQQQLNF
jgi:site-specific DNA-methyltransferase (adenine-specific)